MDNGPEFAGKAMDEWADRRGIKLSFIRPGKPVENAFAESFNRPTVRRMLEHQLVHECKACQGDHRELAAGLQRGQAPQFPEGLNAQRVCWPYGWTLLANDTNFGVRSPRVS